MTRIPVILIFDVGKTNKKILLFDEDYGVVHEESVQLEEITDEDGFPCENVKALTEWVESSFLRLLTDPRFDIKAVNFSGYGASFVYLDGNDKVFLPLYNYLKPYPPSLKEKFYNTYGGEAEFSKKTASPVLGHLNSGLQLYRIRHENPDAFKKMSYALHLPQYLSFILTRNKYSEITSIGCHTNLWDFTKHDYHEWVFREEIRTKLPPVFRSDECISTAFEGRPIQIGIGLHDSSAALIPYLSGFHDPFILLSTGTWCISLNPFNYSSLTKQELEEDCLCYLTYHGKPVKASRLFAGYEHEKESKRISEHYKIPLQHLTSLQYTLTNQNPRHEKAHQVLVGSQKDHSIPFSDRNLNEIEDADAAYYELLTDIVSRQVASTKLVQGDDGVKRIFVDGGFSKNDIYMHLMAEAFPGIEVYAASVAQASALGAALAIHKQWNTKPLRTDLIELMKYSKNVERL
jgi:sugar (pentulose or hexulose) kinase